MCSVIVRFDRILNEVDWNRVCRVSATHLRIDHLVLNYSAQRPFATRTYFRMYSQSLTVDQHKHVTPNPQ